MFKEYQNNFFKSIRRDRRTGKVAVVIKFIDFQTIVLYDQEKNGLADKVNTAVTG